MPVDHDELVCTQLRERALARTSDSVQTKMEHTAAGRNLAQMSTTEAMIHALPLTMLTHTDLSEPGLEMRITWDPVSSKAW